MNHFQKPFNTITVHASQPVQVAKYGIHELSGEEERLIILNSNIVILNIIAKTAEIILCNETESIKVIDNDSQEHGLTSAIIHPALSQANTVSDGSETESMSESMSATEDDEEYGTSDPNIETIRNVLQRFS